MEYKVLYLTAANMAKTPIQLLDGERIGEAIYRTLVDYGHKGTETFSLESEQEQHIELVTPAVEFENQAVYLYWDNLNG